MLSAVVSRVRDRTGAIPLVSFYDPGERLWNPPMPLLFQWQAAGQNRAVSSTTISKALTELAHASGLTDDAGQPLRYQPHDFRRVFATEAILNGMPPHIAQLILGHRDINTTMDTRTLGNCIGRARKPQVNRSQDRRDSVPPDRNTAW
jgi:integrase